MAWRIVAWADDEEEATTCDHCDKPAKIFAALGSGDTWLCRYHARQIASDLEQLADEVA